MSQSSCEAEERHFIGSLVARQPKYGSTVKNVNVFKENRYVQHKLEPSDTLQGLALKYNVSVSDVCSSAIDLLSLLVNDELFSPINQSAHISQ